MNFKHPVHIGVESNDGGEVHYRVLCCLDKKTPTLGNQAYSSLKDAQNAVDGWKGIYGNPELEVCPMCETMNQFVSINPENRA